MKKFEEMYARYYKQTYFYLLKLSNNPDLSEELTQETFFKVLKKIDTFRGECNLSVWICQIAKNTYYTYCRKKELIKSQEYIDTISYYDFENFFVDKELSKEIHKILHKIPEPYKEVFWMRIFGELTFSEIGELLNQSENWSRVVFHRSKIMIREALK